MVEKQMKTFTAGDTKYIINDAEARAEVADLKSQITNINGAVDDLEGEIDGLSPVPTNVRASILELFKNVTYKGTGLTDAIAIIQAWAEAVTAITLNNTTISISGSGTSQLVATTTPSGKTVTWASSDTAVATVNSSGLVTGCGNGTAVITATSGDMSARCTATVTGFVVLESIEATYTQRGTLYSNASLSDLTSDLVVVANYSDTTTTTLASDQYTLSGTLTVGTSTITVSFGGKTDTFTVTVTAVPTVSSIAAVYTQSDIIYDFDNPTLDSLKTDLVVTATWSDTSETTVASADYTLSGSLAVGDNTITVSYSGKTTTFTCRVYGFVFTNGYVNSTNNSTQKYTRIKVNTARILCDCSVGTTPLKDENGDSTSFYAVPLRAGIKRYSTTYPDGYRRSAVILSWNSEANEFVQTYGSGWQNTHEDVLIDQAYRDGSYYIGVTFSGATGSEDMTNVDTSTWSVTLLSSEN